MGADGRELSRLRTSQIENFETGSVQPAGCGNGQINRQWSNKWFRSCHRKPDFFRDLIFVEVSELNGLAASELNGIVRFIVRSVCK